MASPINWMKDRFRGRKQKGERAKDDVTQNLGDQKEKTAKEALKKGNGSVSKKISDQENKGQTLPPGAENRQSRSRGGSQLSMSDHKSSYGQKDGDVEEAQASLDSTVQSDPKSPDDSFLSLSYASEGPCGLDLHLLDSSRNGDTSKIKVGPADQENQGIVPSAETIFDNTPNSQEPSADGTADAASTSSGSVSSGAVAASSCSLSSGAAATSGCVPGCGATADHDAGDTSSDSITIGGAAVDAATGATSSGSVSGGEAAAVDADAASSGSVTESGAAALCNIVRGSGEAAVVGGGAPSSSDGEVDGAVAASSRNVGGAAAAGSRNVGGAAAAGSRNVGGDERAPIEEPENPLEGVVAQRDNSLPSLTTPPIQEERPETETADPTQNRTLEGGEEDLRNEETATQSNRYEQLHISEEIQKDKFLEDMLVCKLDHTVHRCIRNWEHLACTQQVNAPLETRLRCKLISRGSCTRTLIDFLAVEKEDKSVQDLITALKNIRRNDVVKMIKEVYPDATDATDATSASQTKLSDFVASNANNDLIEKITTKLDERSRVNSCWMDLGRQFQLSGEKIKEIELCGESNPTEALMEYLHAKQPGLTVRTFYAKVEEIKRRDVLKKLKPVYDEGPEKPLWDGIKLDSNEMMSICVDLNSQNKALKNWRHLANALQVPRDTYTNFNPQQPKSPTKELLEWISTSKSDLKVGQLCDALESIGRNDVVRDLWNYFEQRPAGN